MRDDATLVEQVNRADPCLALVVKPLGLELSPQHRYIDMCLDQADAHCH